MKGQYLFTTEHINAPEGWTLPPYNKWKVFTAGLQVIDVYYEENRWLGWCIGHPIVDGALEPPKIVLQKLVDQYDASGDFYDTTASQWVLILPAAATPSIYLAPSASLPAVHSTVEKTIAPTPILVGSEADWGEQLMAEVGYPETIHWIPSGLTFKKGVRRLLDNHSLNLSNWKVSRHWPTPETDLSIDNDTDAAVAKITAHTQGTITAVAKRYLLCLTVTTGMN